MSRRRDDANPGSRGVQIGDDLDPLARDLIVRASALLGDGGDDRRVGLELDGEPRIALLHADTDPDPWRELSHSPATGNCDADVLRAAQAPAAPWLGSLPEEVLGNVAFALYRGGRVRLYVRPRSGEIDLVLRFSGGLIDLARHTVREWRPAADERPTGGFPDRTD
jgi:hypothetical protein